MHLTRASLAVVWLWPSTDRPPRRRIAPRPLRDVARVADDLPVVKHEHGHQALAGQSLDRLASAGDVRQGGEAVGLDDLWRVPGRLQRVVCLLAGMRAGRRDADRLGQGTANVPQQT